MTQKLALLTFILKKGKDIDCEIETGPCLGIVRVYEDFLIRPSYLNSHIKIIPTEKKVSRTTLAPLQVI